MAKFLDAVLFTPTAGGTTDFTVAAAVQGYLVPNAAGASNGALYRYRAESSTLNEWEVGYGTYNTGTGVLTRTTVVYNSLGTTAKINFAAPPNVGMGMPFAVDIFPFVSASTPTDPADNALWWNSSSGVLSIYTGGSWTALTGLYATAARGQLPGETSNTLASAGNIGQYVESNGSASFATGTTQNMASLAIPSGGEWELSGWTFISGGGATSLTNYTMSLSPTSLTQDTATSDRYNHFRNAGGISDPFMTIAIGPRVLNLSAAATYYMVGVATFSSILSHNTRMRARRMR